MAEERRKKVVKTNRHADAGQQPGSRENVIRPHRRGEDTGASSGTSNAGATPTQASAPAAAQTIGQVIASCLAGQNASKYADTVWGSNLAKMEAAARSLLAIPANDKVYLVSMVSVLLRGKVALALCDSGLRLRDVNGNVGVLAWKDFAAVRIASQGTTLAIGNSQLAFHDAALLASLLGQIQSRIAR